MLPSIVIIDDDTDYLRELSSGLAKNFDVRTHTSPYFLLNEIGSIVEDVDAIVVDLKLPEIDGLTLVKRFREKFLVAPPISILTQFNTSSERKKAYSNQISDFLCKTLDMEEISLRIKNSILLAKRSKNNQRNLAIKDLHYDSDRMCFVYRETPLSLTLIETRLLYSLLLIFNLPVHKNKVLDHVWSGRSLSTQTLRTHLHNLNTKIKPFNFCFSIDKDGRINLAIYES